MTDLTTLTTDQLRAEQATTYAAMDRLYDEMVNQPYPSIAYDLARVNWNSQMQRWNALSEEYARRENAAETYIPRHALNWDAFNPDDDGFFVREAEANEAGK